MSSGVAASSTGAGVASLRARGHRQAVPVAASQRSSSRQRSLSRPRLSTTKPVQTHTGGNAMAAASSAVHGASPSAASPATSGAAPHAAASFAALSSATPALPAQAHPPGPANYPDETDRPVSASGRPTMGLAAYRVRRHIGRGKFGVCQLVERIDTGKEYVLKAIVLSESSPREREAALAEVATLKRLQRPRPHPFIVRYHESFLWHDTLHIVMQHCSGGDLHAYLKERKVLGQFLPEHTVVDWLIQLLLAIRKSHESHIIHRDIKSQNIFLMPSRVGVASDEQDSSASAFTLKLGDWGISKLLNSTSELAMSIVGTPYSMSPEVCENKPYSFASDIWAMGCVLYEMCTLRHAFDSNNLLGLVWKIVQESYPPIPACYSADLSDLLSAMLAKDPAARPTVDQMLDLRFIKRRLKAQIEERIRARGGDPVAAAAAAPTRVYIPGQSDASSRRSSLASGESNIYDNGMTVNTLPGVAPGDVTSGGEEGEDEEVDPDVMDPSPRSARSASATASLPSGQTMRASPNTSMHTHSPGDRAPESGLSSARSSRRSPAAGSQSPSKQPQPAPTRPSLSISSGGSSAVGMVVPLSLPSPTGSATSSSPFTLSPSHAQLAKRAGAGGLSSSPSNNGNGSGPSPTLAAVNSSADGVSSLRLPRRSKPGAQAPDVFAAEVSAGSVSFRAYVDRRVGAGGSAANSSPQHAAANASSRSQRPSVVLADGTGGGGGHVESLMSPSHNSGSIIDGGSMLLMGGRGGTGSVRSRRPTTTTTTPTAAISLAQRRQSEQPISPSGSNAATPMRMVAFASPTGLASGRSRATSQTTTPGSARGSITGVAATQQQQNLGETVYEISSPRTPGSFKTMPFSAGRPPAHGSSAPSSSSRTTRNDIQLSSPTDAKARRHAAQRIARQGSFDEEGSDEDEEVQRNPKVAFSAPLSTAQADPSASASASDDEDEVSDDELVIEQLQTQLHVDGDDAGAGSDDSAAILFTSDEEDGEDDEDDGSGSDFDDDEGEFDDERSDGEFATEVSSFGPTSGATAAALGLASFKGPASQRMVVESFSAKHDSPRHGRGVPLLSHVETGLHIKRGSESSSSGSAASSSMTASSARKPPLQIQITKAPAASIPTVPVTVASAGSAAAAGFTRHGNAHSQAPRVGSGKKVQLRASAAAATSSSSSAVGPSSRARGRVRSGTGPIALSPRATSTTRPPSLRAKYNAVRERCLRSMSAAAFELVLKHFQQQHLLSPRASLLHSARGAGAAAFTAAEPPSPSPLSPSVGGAENGRHVRAVREMLSRAPGCDARDAQLSPEAVFLVEQAVYLQQVLKDKEQVGQHDG